MENIVCDHECLNTLLIQVPWGWYESPKLLQHLRRGFSGTSGPKPIVFLGFIAVILTSDDLPRKTLEVIGAFTIWEILHGKVFSEFLQHEVGEAIEAVKDPECYQGLHRLTSKFNSASL